MATTYALTKQALDEIAQRINQNQGRLDSARDQVATAEAQLAGMPGQYATIAADLDAAAAAAPGNPALQAAKAEKDFLVAEFQALKTKATAIKDAIDGAI